MLRARPFAVFGLLAAGCAPNTWMVKPYAAQDFDCPSEQITITELASPSTPKRDPAARVDGSIYAWQATGCGKSATYVATNTGRFVALPEENSEVKSEEKCAEPAASTPAAPAPIAN